MNFFEHQDKANRKTSRLIFYFILALVLIILSANGIIYGALILVSQNNPALHDLIYEPIWLYISLGFLIVMGFGSLITMLRVASGGVSIAKMVHARPLSQGPQSFKEKQFINVVHEMSIASGTPVPQLFVMDEPAINAFVAGNRPEDTVMVVTTGALEALNRDEMQAVVGHEFSHIFNGDMKISLRLIGVLGGILAIGKVGEILLRGTRRARYTRSNNKDSGKGVLVILLVGLGLMILGYVGLFFGRLIKAAVSRQRELLADASSVQYTRNPHGLVSAFKVMMSHEKGTHLESNQKEEISHMCIGEAQWVMFGGLLSTHPPLDARIKAIDPNDIYPMLPRQSQEIEASVIKPKQTQLQDFLPMAAGAAIAVTAQAIEASIAQPGDVHVEYAMALNRQIPESIRDGARNQEQVSALLYAMFLLRAVKQGELHEVIGLLDKKMKPEVERFLAIMKDMELVSALPILEACLPTFTALPKKQRLQIYNDGHKILETIHASAFHFACLTILGNRLGIKRSKDKPITKLDAAVKTISYLLAVLLSHSQAPKDMQQAQFKKIMDKLSKKQVEMPSVDKLHFKNLTKCLNILNRLTPLAKEQLIKACVSCVVFDDKILVAEAELLRAVAEALECPMPPIIPSTLHE